MQGESAQFVDPAQIPAAADVARLGQALAAGRRGDLHELMANTAAYTGLRQGELFALTAGQVDPAARVIDVDRKVIEVAGKLLPGRPRAASAARPSTPPAPRRATRSPRRSPPASGRPAPSRQPGPTRRADVPLPPRHLVAVLQLRPPRPGPRLPRRRLARPRTATAPGPGTACGTCSAPPPCSPGNSTPPTSPPSPATPTSASPWTCTSAPPPASSTAPAPPPHNTERQRFHQAATPGIRPN